MKLTPEQLEHLKEMFPVIDINLLSSSFNTIESMVEYIIAMSERNMGKVKCVGKRVDMGNTEKIGIRKGNGMENQSVLEKNIERNAEKNIERNVQKNIEKNIEKNVINNVISNDMKNDIKNDINNDIKNVMKNDINNDMKNVEITSKKNINNTSKNTEMNNNLNFTSHNSKDLSFVTNPNIKEKTIDNSLHKTKNHYFTSTNYHKNVNNHKPSINKKRTTHIINYVEPITIDLKEYIYSTQKIHSKIYISDSCPNKTQSLASYKGYTNKYLSKYPNYSKCGKCFYHELFYENEDHIEESRSDGKCDIRSDGKCNFRSDGKCNIRSDGKCNIRSDGKCNIRSDGKYNIRSDWTQEYGYRAVEQCHFGKEQGNMERYGHLYNWSKGWNGIENFGSISKYEKCNRNSMKEEEMSDGRKNQSQRLNNIFGCDVKLTKDKDERTNNSCIERKSNQITEDKRSVTRNNKNNSSTKYKIKDKSIVTLINNKNNSCTNQSTKEKSIGTLINNKNNVSTNQLTKDKSIGTLFSNKNNLCTNQSTKDKILGSMSRNKNDLNTNYVKRHDSDDQRKEIEKQANTKNTIFDFHSTIHTKNYKKDKTHSFINNHALNTTKKTNCSFSHSKLTQESSLHRDAQSKVDHYRQMYFKTKDMHYNYLASLEILSTYRKVIDFHGLYVYEALMFVIDYTRIKQPHRFEIVVGKSEKIRPRVEELLDELGYGTVYNNGVFYISKK